VIYLTLAIVLFWLWQHILETGCSKYQVKAETFSDGPICSLDAALHLTGPTEHINTFKCRSRQIRCASVGPLLY